MKDEELLKTLKEVYGKDLLCVIKFGSSIHTSTAEDIDILVVAKHLREIPKIGKYSILQLTPREFVENITEKSPLFVGIALMGYEVLYGKKFFYKWLPALLNRIEKEDIVYKAGRVYRLYERG